MPSCAPTPTSSARPTSRRGASSRSSPPGEPVANRASASRSDLGAVAFPVRVAELALVELAAGVAGQLGHEVDRLRALELGEAVLAEREDLVAQLVVRLDADLGLHDGLDLLTPVGVGDAEHGHVA